LGGSFCFRGRMAVFAFGGTQRVRCAAPPGNPRRLGECEHRSTAQAPGDHVHVLCHPGRRQRAVDLVATFASSRFERRSASEPCVLTASPVSLRKTSARSPQQGRAQQARSARRAAARARHLRSVSSRAQPAERGGAGGAWGTGGAAAPLVPHQPPRRLSGRRGSWGPGGTGPQVAPKAKDSQANQPAAPRRQERKREQRGVARSQAMRAVRSAERH
jgi:hypothetical protein